MIHPVRNHAQSCHFWISIPAPCPLFKRGYHCAVCAWTKLHLQEIRVHYDIVSAALFLQTAVFWRSGTGRVFFRNGLDLRMGCGTRYMSHRLRRSQISSLCFIWKWFHHHGIEAWGFDLGLRDRQGKALGCTARLILFLDWKVTWKSPQKSQHDHRFSDLYWFSRLVQVFVACGVAEVTIQPSGNQRGVMKWPGSSVWMQMNKTYERTCQEKLKVVGKILLDGQGWQQMGVLFPTQKSPNFCGISRVLASEFRSERSFNRNIARIHENLKTLRPALLSWCCVHILDHLGSLSGFN